VVGVVVITEALARLMREHVPASVPLIVEPDAVEAAWVESELSQEDARRGLGLSEEHRSIVVYTGHLYAGRGIELVLEAARSLPRHLFMLAGGGDAYVESTRRLAADLDNVEVVGFVPPATVFAYLRAADVLIMPYGRSIAVSGGGDTAAFASPLKMFEYMAAGRPLLSSDLPVLREVLADGVNCRLLPPDEPTAWVAALTELTEKPETGMAWGERARSDAARYTWRARASRLVDRVSELIR
jgi:glycosyltransferase involved in cell wall biosynthesis